MEKQSTSVNELRKKIKELEKALSAYGFDSKRGIETYKVSEIKDILRRAGTREGDAKKILRELLRAQQTLYRELYRMAGIKEVEVDTDMPEKRIREIKEWLEGRKENRGEGVNLFAITVNKVLSMIKEGKDTSSIMELLARSYKRDYDRFRVLEFLVKLCEELGAKAERPRTLNELADFTMAQIYRIGVDKVWQLAMARLRK